MFIIKHFSSARDPNPGTSIQRIGDIGSYATAAEARTIAENRSRQYAKNGYNGERDYFWGWDEGDNTVNYFSIQRDPADSIINNTFMR